MDLSLNIQRMLLSFPPLMVALVFHEFAHGLVASRWGDQTARDSGRLTLNPIPHIDPIGTLVLPIMMMVLGVNVLFGWAKPVPINPNRFRKFRQGLFWVSLAGPGMNVFMAILSAFFLCTFILLVPRDFYLFEPLIIMTQISIGINYALAIFNLIPLPPLDGSKIVESFLSYPAMQKYERVAQYSFWILMALIFTGAIRILAYPITFMADITLYAVASLFGIGGLV